MVAGWELISPFSLISPYGAGHRAMSKYLELIRSERTPAQAYAPEPVGEIRERREIRVPRVWVPDARWIAGGIEADLGLPAGGLVLRTPAQLAAMVPEGWD